MTDRAAFLAEFKRLTRDSSGNAIVAWRARDQTGAVLDHGMNNATAIWASRPDGSVIEIEVDGRWIPATSQLTQETKTAPAAETGAATEEGQSAMDQMCAEAPELQEPERSDLHEAAPPDALEVPLTVTFFDDAAAAAKREQGLSLSDLAVVFIPTATAATKAGLPWLKLARFGDVRSAKGSLRHNGNVVTITGIEADYDGERVTVNQACDLLRAAKLAAVVYTSPSHTDAAPRWRVLCPLSAETAPDQRAALVGRLNGVLGGVLSRESFTLSQSYYFGSVNSNPAHRVEQIDGDPIDLRDDLPVVGVPVAAPTVRQDGPFDWDQREKSGQPQKPMSEEDIAWALSKDSRGSRSEDAFAFVNRLRRDHNYTPREIVDTLADHADLPVMGHYGEDGDIDEGRVCDDVQRAFTKKDPTDRPSAEVFKGYSEKHGVAAPGVASGFSKALVSGGLVKITTRYGTFAEAMDLLRDLTEAGKAEATPEERDQARRAERFRVYTEADIETLALPKVLIEGLLFDGADTYTLSGDMGAYKTFLLSEVAHSVASGKPCFGTLKMLGKPAPVLLFLGEAATTALKQRWPALRRDRSGGLKHPKLPIYFIRAVPSVGSDVDVKFCLDQARKIRKAEGRPFGLIGLDTLTRLTSGLDSNTSETGNLVTALTEGMAQEFGCPVWVNSHHGKSGPSKGTSGSFVVEANSGNVWRVEADPLDKRSAAIRTGRQWACITPYRLKDAPDWGPIYLAGRRLYGADGASDGLALDGIGEEAFKLLKAAGAGGPQDTGAAIVRDVGAALKRLGAVDEQHAIATTHLAKRLAYAAAASGTRNDDLGLRTTEGQWYNRLVNSARPGRVKDCGLAVFQRRLAPPGDPVSTKVGLRWCLPDGYVVVDDDADMEIE